MFESEMIRAASGDAQAIARIVRMASRDRSIADHFIALLRCDPEPHPLALLAAAAIRPHASATAHFAVRRLWSAAGRTPPVDAFLLDALYWRPSDAAPAMPDDAPEPSAALAVLAMLTNNANLAAQAIIQIGATQWTNLPATMRAALVTTVARRAAAASHSGGAVWTRMSATERNCIARAAARNARASIRLLKAMGGAGWTDLSAQTRKAMLETICATPETAEYGGLVWADLTDEERTTVANAAAGDAEAAGGLMQIIGAEGWAITPAAAQRALLQAFHPNSYQMACGVGVVWRALSNDERKRIVASCLTRTTSLSSSSDLMAHMKAEGWEVTPPDVREALLQSVLNTPFAAAEGGSAVWTALSDDEKRVIARVVEPKESSAAELMAQMKTEGWAVTPPDVRDALLRSVRRGSFWASYGGAAVWIAMRDDERLAIVQSVTNELDDFLYRIDSKRWTATAGEARAALLQSICSTPWRAATFGGKVWSILTDAERVQTALTAARRADCAARLMISLGSDTWSHAPADGRIALLRAVQRSAHAAASGGGAVWSALSAEDQTSIAVAAAATPQSAAQLMQRIGSAGWRAASTLPVAALLQAVCADPKAAAAGGGAVWAALNEQEREQIMNAALRDSAACALLIEQVCSDPLHQDDRLAHLATNADLLHVAAHNPNVARHAILAFGDALNAGRGMRFLRVAFADRSNAASRAVAQALRLGAPWRGWMAAFAPDADADADLKAEWTQYASHLPLPLAAALLTKRRPRW